MKDIKSFFGKNFVERLETMGEQQKQVSGFNNEIISFELPTKKDESIKLSENSPVNYEVDVSVFKGEKPLAVIIVVGKGGSVNGYHDKYSIISHNLVKDFGVNVFVVENPGISWDNPELFFDCAMKCVSGKMDEFGYKKWNSYVMGFSAGGHFTGRFAHKYPEIKKILMINPVLSVNFNRLKKDVLDFKGEVTIVQGDNDIDFAFNPLLEQITNAKIVILPGVTHQFSNEGGFELFLGLPEQYLFGIKKENNMLKKALGVMVGGAVGDALGAPVEFCSIDDFDWVNEYRSYGGLEAGEWTDDTAMALLLADSLVRCKGFNIEDQLENYLKWHKTGYMGLRDFPEGEGVQVSKMMYYYEMYKNGAFTDKPWDTDLSGQYMDGNGSLMRIGPIPVFYHDDPEKALFYAGESSKSTHHTDLCIGSCIYYTGLIIGAMNGVSKDKLLEPYYSPIDGYWKKNKLADALKPIVEGSYKSKDRYEINPSGYVVETLETALRGFYNSTSFRDGMEKIVNLGGDADTTGCIYGYLAGAYYGYDSIPESWKKGLAERSKIEKMTKNMLILSK